MFKLIKNSDYFRYSRQKIKAETQETRRREERQENDNKV